MLPRLGFTQHAQAAIMRVVLCGGFVGLLFPAIVAFGPFPTVQAAESIHPNHQVQAAPARIDTKLPASRLAAVLANRVSAGPQASALPALDAGTRGLG